MFVSSKGDRLDAQNYLVLLTDGKSNYGSNPVKEAAATCKNAGVRIITVGIGNYNP
jgi:Mg-chelatase subunit ChlD